MQRAVSLFCLLCMLGACESALPAPLPFAVAAVSLHYPTPAWSSGTTMIAAGGWCLSASLLAETPVATELTQRGLSLAPPCALTLEWTTATAMGDVAAIPSDWHAHDGGCAWSIDAATLTLFAADARAADYAVHALASHLDASGGSVPTLLADWPAFPLRGVVEGFYNRTLLPYERTVTLSLMHALRQNTYLYAPKSDDYAGYRWADAYPAADAATLAAAITTSAQLGIDFVYGISPTLAASGMNASWAKDTSLTFSSASDVAALDAKLAGLRALGVKRFALLFDDAGGQLVHAADEAAFTSLADAHASLANHLVTTLGGPLLFVGTAYTSSNGGWQDYVTTLGSALDPAVAVMWTGSATWSPTIASSDLSSVDKLLGRDVVIWDNWPIKNGPVTGRDSQLFTAATGDLSNATLVGDFGYPITDFWGVLGPIAAYSWSPTSYDASPSNATSIYNRWQPELAAMEDVLGLP